jgi:hypothetical protein
MSLRSGIDAGVAIMVARLDKLTGKTDKASVSEARDLTRTLADIEAARTSGDNQRAALLVALIVGRRGLDKLAPADRERATKLLLGDGS